MDMVLKVSMQLPAYLEATTSLLGHPVELVVRAATVFEQEMGSAMLGHETKLQSLTVLQGGRRLALALQNASRHFTPEVYNSLRKEATNLIRYFNSFGARAITPEFRGYLKYADSLLKPAIMQLDRVRAVFEVREHWEHLRSLAEQVLWGADRVGIPFNTPWPPAGLSESQLFRLESAVEHTFESISGLGTEMEELQAPGATCLEEADCVADLQVHVRTARGHVRSLLQALRPLSFIAESLQPSLVSVLDVPDFVMEVVDDLDVLSTWSQTMSGRVPNSTSPDSSPIQQQFTRGLCKEMQQKAIQGRASQRPSWFEGSCESIDDFLYDTDANPYQDGIETAAEMADLFLAKTTEVIHAFDEEFLNISIKMLETTNSADGASREYDVAAVRFVRTFRDAAEVFDQTRGYIDKMQDVFDLKEGLLTRCGQSTLFTTAVPPLDPRPTPETRGVRAQVGNGFEPHSRTRLTSVT